MQTFLTDRSFSATASILDNKRLNKQVVEAMQILNANKAYERHRTLHGMYDMTFRIGWVNHPATKMWRGYNHLLCIYALAMIRESSKRGINNSSMLPVFDEELSRSEFLIPPWMTDERLDKVLTSHRASLYRKDPVHYAQFADAPDVPYFWPVP